LRREALISPSPPLPPLSLFFFEASPPGLSARDQNDEERGRASLSPSPSSLSPPQTPNLLGGEKIREKSSPLPPPSPSLF